MNTGRGQLLEQPDGPINGTQRFCGEAQEPANFLGRAAGKFREMLGRVDFSDRAAVVLVPVGMLENELADLGLGRRVRVQLCDHTRRVPLEQHTTRIEDDIPDHGDRFIFGHFAATRCESIAS